MCVCVCGMVIAYARRIGMCVYVCVREPDQNQSRTTLVHVCMYVCVCVRGSTEPTSNRCTAWRACLLCMLRVVWCVCVCCVCARLCACMHAFSHDPASGGTTRCPELFLCMHTCTLCAHVYVRTCIHALGGPTQFRPALAAFCCFDPIFCTNACLSSMGLSCLSHGGLSLTHSLSCVGA
jgi:hypothetical protein